jgi:AraC family transcriptional regulator of adaptative response / DNA-3-methyladenine glycosylase II
VRRWFDLDADPLAIDAALADLPGGAGLRLPGGPDAFELIVRAVLGQQVMVAAARTLAARLVARYGDAITTPWPEVQRAFPAPAALAGAGVQANAEADPVVAELGALGIIRSRGAAIVAGARAWPEIAPLTAPQAVAAGARRAIACRPRHRAVDGGLRRDARTRLGRRLPARRRRRPQRARPRPRGAR